MTASVILALAVFGASAVEMVEALTIVLAAGISTNWRSTLQGAATAVAVLAVLVAAVGAPLIHLVPLDGLRVVVGGLLLVLGLNWFRKAVLRASGHKAVHDEDAIYADTVRSFSDERRATGFVVAFKGVFLEGLEVVMIVLTLGSSSGHLLLAALAATAAVVVVGIVGLVVARQLSEVPENAMKMAVAIMLTSFGVFWIGEGAGLQWPGSDLFLLALVALFCATAALGTRLMRRALPAGAGPAGAGPAGALT
ncbi:MAG: hypothetical protein ACRD0Z_01150 [Acidimicrobiales bacterium]